MLSNLRLTKAQSILVFLKCICQFLLIYIHQPGIMLEFNKILYFGRSANYRTGNNKKIKKCRIKQCSVNLMSGSESRCWRHHLTETSQKAC